MASTMSSGMGRASEESVRAKARGSCAEEER